MTKGRFGSVFAGRSYANLRCRAGLFSVSFAAGHCRHGAIQVRLCKESLSEMYRRTLDADEERDIGYNLLSGRSVDLIGCVGYLTRCGLVCEACR